MTDTEFFNELEKLGYKVISDEEYTNHSFDKPGNYAIGQWSINVSRIDTSNRYAVYRIYGASLHEARIHALTVAREREACRK